MPRYEVSFEIDGIVDEYLEIFIQYTFICLFGVSFPLSFILTLFNNICEI